MVDFWFSITSFMQVFIYVSIFLWVLAADCWLVWRLTRFFKKHAAEKLQKQAEAAAETAQE